MKKTLALILAVLMCLALFAGCGQSAAPAASSAKTEDKKLDAKEIVIGWVGPQTGPSAYLGLGQVMGLEIAVDEINAEGGILGVPVRLEMRDDESDPTKSLTYVEELIYKEGMNVHIGQSNSACAAATASLTTEEKILTFHPVATSGSAVNADTPYAFRCHASNDVQAAGLVNLAVNAGFKSAAIMGDTSDLGVNGMQSLEKYAKEYGLEIVDKITFVANDADLSPVANSIKASGAPLVLSYALGADAAKIVTALDRINYLSDVTIIGYSGTMTNTLTELAKEMDVSRVFGVQTGEVCIRPGQDKLFEGAQKFYDKVVERYGPYTLDGSGRTSSIGCGARTYETVYMTKWLIEQTGSLDAEVLAKYMEEHGTEYPSRNNELGYLYSADNHEGYNPENIISVQATAKANDGVNYFGDIWYGVEITAP